MDGIATVGVVGLGTMGAGIVEVFARSGLDVIALDVDDAAVGRGRSILESSVSRAADKGRISPSDASALRDRITWTSEIWSSRPFRSASTSSRRS
jgi:3-hydroxybutyryl-CoA dehydrogenase